MSSSEAIDWEVVRLVPGSVSDGDPEAWPKGDRFRRIDDSHYRHKLATMWLQRRGQLEEGKTYILEKLPDNYVLFDRPRRHNPELRDKFLWGHPTGHYYQSPNQLFPHFYWLMNGRAGQCVCENCKKRKKGETMTTQIRPKFTAHKLRGPYPTTPNVRTILDPDGTPDVFRTAVLKLKERGSLEEEITEPRSMDWRAEKRGLQQQLTKLSLQASYIPRVGEVILWIPTIEGELVYDDRTQTIRMYSFKEERFLGLPDWRAGTVGQAPEEDVVLEDLIEPMPKQWAVNYSGFRVETFPDTNDSDKSASLQSKYVYINCIRPLSSWIVLLHGTPQKDWHPSIKYALTIMSSISLVDRYRFKGSWPNASIYCHGIFLGPELLVVGDTVRLKPRGAQLGRALPRVTDVMVIDRIELKLISCIDDIRSPLLAEKYAVRVRGKVYTRSWERAYRELGEIGPLQPLSHDQVTDAFQYIGMNGYGAWFRLHAPGKSMCISHDMIVGRCYEPDAMKLLYDDTDLGIDLHGVLCGRQYSRQTDNRMRIGQDWFWGDYRTQTLAIDSLNGEDVGRYNEARNPKMWRGCLQIIDGSATPVDIRDAALPRDVGRPAGSRNSKFAEVGKTSTLVSSGLGGNLDTSANVSSDESDSAEEEDVSADGKGINIAKPIDKVENDNDEDDNESDSSKDEEESDEADASKPLPIRGGIEEIEEIEGNPFLEWDRQFKRPKFDF